MGVEVLVSLAVSFDHFLDSYLCSLLLRGEVMEKKMKERGRTTYQTSDEQDRKSTLKPIIPIRLYPIP